MVHPTDPPSTFEEAVAIFSQFLERNGYSSPVRWITKDQLVIEGDPALHWVCASGAVSAKAEALRRYEIGLQRGLGIIMQAICSTSDETIANIVIPEDPRDAECRRVYGSLKCSCPATRVEARAIENSSEWMALLEEFQSRAHVMTTAYDL